MALTKAKVREILSAAGVDAEHMSDAVNAIIDGHVASIDALREENAALKKDAERFPELQKELEDLKATAKDGTEYEKLKAEYKKYKDEVKAKETRAAKETALKEILKDLNFSDSGVAKVLKYHDIDSLELDEEGKINGAGELRKSLKEEWGDYIKTEGTKGVSTPNPPGGAGGAKLTTAEIYKTDDKGRYVMDATARQAALAEMMANE